MSGSASPPAAARISGTLLAIVLLVVAALAFLLIYVLYPANQHVNALLAIGAVALVFAFVAYLSRSITPSPAIAQATSWGFAAMGFGLLFLTLAFAPSGTIGTVGRILGGIVVLLVLAISLAGIGWRSKGSRSDSARMQERAAWAQQPAVNALDYPTAAPPSPPTSGPGAR